MEAVIVREHPQHREARMIGAGHAYQRDMGVRLCDVNEPLENL